LPEAGDWSLGIDATPLFSYAKSFIGAGINANTPAWNFLTTNQTITGKYFKDATNAYRGSVRIGFGGNTQRAMVDNRMNSAHSPTANGYPAQNPQVENTWK